MEVDNEAYPAENMTDFDTYKNMKPLEKEIRERVRRSRLRKNFRLKIVLERQKDHINITRMPEKGRLFMLVK